MADPSHSTPRPLKPRLDWKQVLGRSLRLRCPHCGQGEVCRGWFHLHEECSVCGYDYRREPGFYLGSIYFNYGLTALLLTIVCGPLVLLSNSLVAVTSVALVFCIVFPIWFLRYARSLWLGFDYFWDRTRARRPGKRASDTPSPAPGEPDKDQESDDEISWKPPVEWTPEGSSEEARSERPTELTMPCPYCHELVHFKVEHQGQWQLCPHCEQQILLLAVDR